MLTVENPADSTTSPETSSPADPLPAWLKLSVIAAASALAGGLAAAWFYRKTVSKLQNAEPHAHNTDFGMSPGEPHDDI